ncbi:hypothetical protein Lsai_0568 [Legionella sainthelensi]|uniref:Coiled-coil protein n=1 Tax=Legionella sainthelensi TaxID=28087 RepID=A0A0W0YRZ3_9GAMM|nr:hypothetical protein [Legionella sainthelensi]KTD59657.1 hypothetical protein Lsai_0568 [Legionella sainthelensi]VEH35919.1 Uncharacterised protein [Legionella sainthelensi]
MNNDEENKKTQALLNSLDPLVEEINQALMSSKAIPNKRKEISLILMKISTYKNLRKNHQKSDNVKAEIESLASIFSSTDTMLKNISEGEHISEYLDNGLFQKFNDISDEMKRLVE